MPAGSLLFRWRGVLAYDGTGYQGWQRQADNRPTIQGALEEALTTLAEHPVPMALLGFPGFCG
ncbi:MAG: tRNA pseudouridine(38-40) synthase TruA, partial [bacterium]